MRTTPPPAPATVSNLRRRPPNPARNAPWNTVITPETRAAAQELARRATEEANLARQSRQRAEAEASPVGAGGEGLDEYQEPTAPPSPRRVAVTSESGRLPPGDEELDVPRPLDEAKHAEFVKLAEPRVTKALNDLDLIKYLASKERYDYTKEDPKEILDALLSKLRELETAFAEEGRRRPRVIFQLSSSRHKTTAG